MSRQNLLLCFVLLLLSLRICSADPLNHWLLASSGTTNNLNAIVYTNHLFIAVGDGGTVLTSPDGVSWANQTSGTTNALNAIAFGAGTYVAVGVNDTVLTSVDATNWTVHANATGQGDGFALTSIVYGNGQFVLAQNNWACLESGNCPVFVANIYTSTDGLTWTFTHYTTSAEFKSLTFGNGLFACLLNGFIMTSSDTTNWTYTSGNPTSATALTFANGQFYCDEAVNSGPPVYYVTYYFATSTTGTNWSNATHFPNNVYDGPIAIGQDQFSNSLAVVAAPTAFITGSQVGSTNDTWTLRPSPVSTGYSAIAFGQNPAGTSVFAAVGHSNIVYCNVYVGAYVWTNTASGNWSDANNWNFHQVPGQANALNSPDDVAITNAGTYTVVLDEGGTYWDVHGLTLGADAGNGTQTLVMNSKTLYVNPLTITGGGVLNDNGSVFHAGVSVENGGQINSVNGTYFVAPFAIRNGGQLNTSGNSGYATFIGDVHVQAGGVWNMVSSWTQVTKDASLTVETNGTVNLFTYVYLSLQGPITNYGTINLIGSNGGLAMVYVDNDGPGGGNGYKGGIWNLPGGTVSLIGTNNGYSLINNGNGSGPFFVNRGTLLANGASSPCGVNLAVFDNSNGSVSNFSGTLQLKTFTNALSGTFYAATNTAIQFTGGTEAAPLTDDRSLAITGSGAIQFVSGWLDLTNDVIPNLQLVGGVFKLEPTFQGGAITNLALYGGVITNLTLPVTGTFTVMNNQIYGNCAVKNGGQLITGYNYAMPTFHGNLTIESGGLLTDTSGWMLIPNDGSFTVQSGGVANFPSYTYLSLQGPLTNAGNVNLTGASGALSQISIDNDGPSGPNQYKGGIWNLPGGTISLNGIGNGYSIINNGNGSAPYLVNQGLIAVTHGSTASLINLASVTNSGVISVLAGSLQINNVTLQSSGTLNMRINSKTDCGRIYINNNASLGGTISLTRLMSYTPAVSDSFTPLTYNSYSGLFSATNLPAGTAWQTTYNPTALTFTAAQTGLFPIFTTTTLSSGSLVFNGSNGVPGTAYSVLASTNVAWPAANWASVATNVFDGNGNFSFTNQLDGAKPQQFYLLKLQ